MDGVRLCRKTKFRKRKGGKAACEHERIFGVTASRVKRRTVEKTKWKEQRMTAKELRPPGRIRVVEKGDLRVVEVETSKRNS